MTTKEKSEPVSGKRRVSRGPRSRRTTKGNGGKTAIDGNEQGTTPSPQPKQQQQEHHDSTMFKWDSWKGSLDPDKLDAMTRDDKGVDDEPSNNEAENCACVDEETQAKIIGAGIQTKDPLFKQIRDFIRKYGKADRSKAYRVVGITAGLWIASMLLWMVMWHRVCGPESPECYEQYGTIWRMSWILFRGLVLVRVFIVFHDCCHLAFLPTPKENRVVGIITGIILLTPYEYWRGTHVLHHRVYGNSALHDPARTTRFTRQEYESMPLWKKTLCRFFRDPFVFFVVAPIMLFMIVYRFMRGGMIVNLGKLLEWTVCFYLSGGGFSWFRDELCSSIVAGAVGFMLFHLQHHVNISYFEPPEKHTVEQAAIYGSTMLHIPWYLKWFSLGIEYHHIHHFNMRVPCYNLQQCHEDAPDYFWEKVPKVPPHKALRGLFNTMWNPERYRYESFWPYEPILQATLGE